MQAQPAHVGLRVLAAAAAPLASGPCSSDGRRATTSPPRTTSTGKRCSFPQPLAKHAAAGHRTKEQRLLNPKRNPTKSDAAKARRYEKRHPDEAAMPLQLCPPALSSKRAQAPLRLCDVCAPPDDGPPLLYGMVAPPEPPPAPPPPQQSVRQQLCSQCSRHWQWSRADELAKQVLTTVAATQAAAQSITAVAAQSVPGRPPASASAPRTDRADSGRSVPGDTRVHACTPPADDDPQFWATQAVWRAPSWRVASPEPSATRERRPADSRPRASVAAHLRKGANRFPPLPGPQRRVPRRTPTAPRGRR